MRISSVKEATDKYTGCVLVGNYSYAYFDPIDYRFQTVKVRRLLKDVKAQWENYGEELLEWLREYIYDSISDSK